MSNYGFNKGFNQVQRGDINKARTEIMKALNIKTPAAFHNRMKGGIEPKVTEKDRIIAIFGKYGITEIWDAES